MIISLICQDKILAISMLMKKTIIDGNKNIINFCKNKKILVYYFSTSLIYGFSKYEKEEGSSKKPGCKYSKLKLNAEKIIQHVQH